MSCDHHQSAQIRSEPIPPCSYTTSSTIGSLQGFHSCWSEGLERAARWEISTVTDDFLSTSKNLAFHTVIYADII